MHASCTHDDYTDWQPTEWDGISTRSEIICSDCGDETLEFLAGNTWVIVDNTGRGAHRL